MKSKITLFIAAGLALASFTSCEVFVRGGGHGRGHSEHHEHSNIDNVQPANSGLQHSFATPSLLQPSAQLPLKSGAIFEF